jgi:uncharacterized protein (TIGR03435 family)
MLKSLCVSAVVVSAVTVVHAQSDGSARYEVVSIKRNTTGWVCCNSPRYSPDGSFMMVNWHVRSLISPWSVDDAGAGPVLTRDIVGLPDWVDNERYDVIAKAPTGAARRSSEMMRNLLKDRFNFASHLEQQERNTFALVLANRNGNLGPHLQPTTKSCIRRDGDPPIEPCETRAGAGMFAKDSTTMAGLALALQPLTDRIVNDRTGLQGFYKFTLKFRPTGPIARITGATIVDPDAPDIFMAVQDQLGLKLQSEKSIVPVLVVDRIERPTQN